MLEVAIANLCSTDKDHQEKILATSAINGRIAHGKEKLLKNEIVDAKASSLVKAVVAFVKQLSKDTVVSKAKGRSQTRMDDSKVFVPSKLSIRGNICNKLSSLSSGTACSTEENW